MPSCSDRSRCDGSSAPTGYTPPSIHSRITRAALPATAVLAEGLEAVLGSMRWQVSGSGAAGALILATAHRCRMVVGRVVVRRWCLYLLTSLAGTV